MATKMTMNSIVRGRAGAAALAQKMAPLAARWSVFWDARTRGERQYLRFGGAALALALLYLLLVAPALAGRARLERNLPQLHEQNAQLQALALEVGALAANRTPSQPATRDSVEQSMARHGLTAQSTTLIGDFAKIQLNNVAFANLLAWLDDVQRSARVNVQDASVTAQGTPGTVNATLTLRLKKSE